MPEATADWPGDTSMPVLGTPRAGLVHVFAHRGADGLLRVDEYRGSRLAPAVAKLRDRLPRLRETVSFADWERFCAPGDSGRPLPDVDPGDPAQILYTSGTTGRP